MKNVRISNPLASWPASCDDLNWKSSRTNCASPPVNGIWQSITIALLLLFTLGINQGAAQQSRDEARRFDSIGDPLPSNALQRFGTQRLLHPSSVIAIALAPNEQTLVSLSQEELIGWDTQTGKELWRGGRSGDEVQLNAASYGVNPMVFSSSSDYFYTVRTSSSVVRRDTRTGEKIVVELPNSLPDPGRGNLAPKSIDVTRDGKSILLGGAFGVSVSTVDGHELFSIKNNSIDQSAFDEHDRLSYGGHFCLAAFSSDETRIALVKSESPKKIYLVNARTGQSQHTIELSSSLVRLDFSPDSTRLAATQRDSSVRVYDLATSKPLWSHTVEPHPTAESYTSAIAFSPDGKTLAAGASIGAREMIYLFDAVTGQVKHIMLGHAWKPWTLAFSSSGKLLYSAGWDGPIRRWDVESGKQLPLPIGQRGSSVIAPSPDGRLLAYADDDAAVHVTKRDSVSESATHQGFKSIHQLAFSRDSLWLAIGGEKPNEELCVQIVDTKINRTVAQWTWPKGKDPHSSIECLKFSADGQSLAAAVFRQSAVLMWNVIDGKQSARLTHKNVYGLSFDSASQRLITAGWDKTVRFWEPATGEIVSQHSLDGIQGPRGVADARMYTVCASPADAIYATAHLDGMVRVWRKRMDQLELVSQFSVGQLRYGSIAFSSDGLWLAVGNGVGDISIFDWFSGQPVRDVGRHRDLVERVEFGRDARTLVSGGADDVGYVWNLQPPKVVRQLSSHDELWRQLASADASEAYGAYWQFIELADASVHFIRDQILPVEVLLDVRQQTAGMTAAQAQSRKELSEILVSKSADVEFAERAIRAISILANIDHPSAREILVRLSQTSPNERLRMYASAAVRQ